MRPLSQTLFEATYQNKLRSKGGDDNRSVHIAHMTIRVLNIARENHLASVKQSDYAAVQAFACIVLS
jgi:hypothetical protein